MRNLRCFEGSCVSGGDGRESVFSYSSWVSMLPIFHDISFASIMRSWHEIAFSLVFKPHYLPSWCFPPPGLGKFNFDGSAIGNPSIEGIEGVIRDSSVVVPLSFYGPAGICFVNKA